MNINDWDKMRPLLNVLIEFNVISDFAAGHTYIKQVLSDEVDIRITLDDE